MAPFHWDFQDENICLQRNFSQILKYTEWVRQCFTPGCGTNSKWYCVRKQKPERQWKTGWGGREGGTGRERQSPPCCLCLQSFSTWGREAIKPLYEENVTLLSTTKEASGCCQSRQNSRGILYASEDKHLQEHNNIQALENNLSCRCPQTLVIYTRRPVKPTPCVFIMLRPMHDASAG